MRCISSFDAAIPTGFACADTLPYSGADPNWHDEHGMVKALLAPHTVVCIHLDRNVADANGDLTKVDRLIDFFSGCQVPHFTGPSLQCQMKQYQVLAAIAHLGSHNGGHYRSLLRCDLACNDQSQAFWLTDDNEPMCFLGKILGTGAASGQSANAPFSDDAPQPAASSSSRPPVSDSLADQDQRGHRIRHWSGGAFCVKCGKQTARIEHLNPRIRKKPCPFANLPSSAWMDTPGKMKAKARLDQLEEKLRTVYNKKPQHDLYWNRLVGKNASDLTTYGRLWCRRCGRTFGWKFRRNNLPRTRCVPCDPPPTIPDWVQTTTGDGAASVVNRPRRRLRGKTPASNVQ